MRRFSLKRLPSPALAVAFVALLAALSGTAIALPGKNTVDSGDLKKGAVRGKDIRKNAVTGRKVKNNSLTGSDVRNLTGGDVNDNSLGGNDVKDNSLGGNDVNESSLGKVPSATQADAAATAGNGLRKVSFRGAANTATTTFFDAGGLVLKASCDGAGDLTWTMESSVNDASVFADTHDHDGNGDAGADGDEAQADFDTGDVVDLGDLHGDDGQRIEIGYTNPNGTEVFVFVHNFEATASAACLVSGVASVL